MGHNSLRRRNACLFAAAFGAAGLGGFGNSNCPAGLIMDVRAVSTTGQLVNPKSVILSNLGDTITLAVFARVSGANGINDEMLQSASGSLHSAGSVKGNLTGGVVTPFNGASSTNGSVLDFDSDGDLDLGSAGSSSTGKIFARSNQAEVVPGNVDAQTGELQIAQATFTYTGGALSADIEYLVRTNATGGPINSSALWYEDGSTISRSPTTGTFAASAPVHVEIPEPASLGLLSLASAGLLRRPRERRS